MDDGSPASSSTEPRDREAGASLGSDGERHDDAMTEPTTPEPVVPAAPAGPAVADPARGPEPEPVDLGRRRFFRQFAGELVQTAATMAGAAQAIQRASVEAAAGHPRPDDRGQLDRRRHRDAAGGIRRRTGGRPFHRPDRVPDTVP